MFVSAPFIADFYRMPQLVLLTRILTIGIVIGAFGGIQGAVMSINLDFKTPAKISIISTLLSGIIGILFAFMGYGVWALVIQSLVATTIGTLGKIYFVRWRPSEPFSKQSFKELFGFSSKLLASWLIGSIYENMYTMVIGKFFQLFSLDSMLVRRVWHSFLQAMLQVYYRVLLIRYWLKCRMIMIGLPITIVVCFAFPLILFSYDDRSFVGICIFYTFCADRQMGGGCSLFANYLFCFYVVSHPCHQSQSASSKGKE